MLCQFDDRAAIKIGNIAMQGRLQIGAAGEASYGGVAITITNSVFLQCKYSAGFAHYNS